MVGGGGGCRDGSGWQGYPWVGKQKQCKVM